MMIHPKHGLRIWSGNQIGSSLRDQGSAMSEVVVSADEFIFGLWIIPPTHGHLARQGRAGSAEGGPEHKREDDKYYLYSGKQLAEYHDSHNADTQTQALFDDFSRLLAPWTRMPTPFKRKYHPIQKTFKAKRSGLTATVPRSEYNNQRDYAVRITKRARVHPLECWNGESGHILQLRTASSIPAVPNVEVVDASRSAVLCILTADMTALEAIWHVQQLWSGSVDYSTNPPSRFATGIKSVHALQSILLWAHIHGLGLDSCWRHKNENRAPVIFITTINQNGCPVYVSANVTAETLEQFIRQVKELVENMARDLLNGNVFKVQYIYLDCIKLPTLSAQALGIRAAESAREQYLSRAG
ncbi:hypothetical protein B0H10DRAFT_1955638 [Mycena sp. CBHHK59/15]|nr:hypothetical protein B0H10DRAFT_1955638 [Mycena sp. CBHHK59/15]